MKQDLKIAKLQNCQPMGWSAFGGKIDRFEKF